MTNRTLFTFLCASAAVSQIAFARLGETEAQCADRYGIAKQDASNQMFPLIDGAQHCTYYYNGWRIRVAFVDGVAVREQYSKIPAADVSPLIKDFELSAILQGEQGGGTWKRRQPQASLNPVTVIQKTLEGALVGNGWIRTDGAVAFCRPGLDTVVRLETPAAAQADAHAKQVKEQKQRGAVPQF